MAGRWRLGLSSLCEATSGFQVISEEAMKLAMLLCFLLVHCSVPLG